MAVQIPDNIYNAYQQIRQTNANALQGFQNQPQMQARDWRRQAPQAQQPVQNMEETPQIVVPNIEETKQPTQPQPQEQPKNDFNLADYMGDGSSFVFQQGMFAPQVTENEPQGVYQSAEPYIGNGNYQTLATPIQDGIEDAGLKNTNPALKYGVDALNAWTANQFGEQLEVSGGWRSEKHNAEVNGSPTSHHLHGNALDVVVPSNFTAEQLEAVKAQARAMGFNSDGEDMYHDRGSGYHLHLTLPNGLN